VTQLPPVAANQSITTAERHADEWGAHRHRSESNPITYSINTNGTIGTAVVTNPATGAFTYTPQANAYGSDFVLRSLRTTAR